MAAMQKATMNAKTPAAITRMAKHHFLQTPHVPPSLWQCLQAVQFLQALHGSAPVHVAKKAPLAIGKAIEMARTKMIRRSAETNLDLNITTFPSAACIDQNIDVLILKNFPGSFLHFRGILHPSSGAFQPNRTSSAYPVAGCVSWTLSSLLWGAALF